MKRLLVCAVSVFFLVFTFSFTIEALEINDYKNSIKLSNSPISLSNELSSYQILIIIAILSGCILSVAIMLFALSKLKLPKENKHIKSNSDLNHSYLSSIPPVSTEWKKCLFCNTLNESNSQECKKCGRNLNRLSA